MLGEFRVSGGLEPTLKHQKEDANDGKTNAHTFIHNDDLRLAQHPVVRIIEFPICGLFGSQIGWMTAEVNFCLGLLSKS